MLGGRSIQLARVLGIRIGADPSWFLVLFLVIYSLAQNYRELFPGDEVRTFALATVTALMFFASILLHELGHAVIALRNGIRIAGIDLWLFGGVARMTREADSAGVEFRVAVAGPVVTLVIALVCFGAGAALSGVDGFLAALRGRAEGPVQVALVYLMLINCVVLVFNLLPGFPLDGGRIARAIAWWRTGDRARATRFAALLGRLFAYCLVGLGAFLALRSLLDSTGSHPGDVLSGVWLLFIGLFLGQAARQAEMQSRISQRVEGLLVADVMDAEPVAVPSATRLDRVLEEFFLRYRWGWFPVVDAGGRLLGLIRRERVDEVPEAQRAERSVEDVMSAEGERSLRVGVDEPVEALLGSEALQRLGALLAVDRDGVLRGVVTVERVRRALRPSRAAV